MSDSKSETIGITVPGKIGPMLLCVKSFDSLLGVAYFKATPDDLAAAGFVPASLLTAANTRVTELEKERISSAGLDAVWRWLAAGRRGVTFSHDPGGGYRIEPYNNAREQEQRGDTLLEAAQATADAIRDGKVTT